MFSNSKISNLEMFILDVMRHDDAEKVSSIVNMLNDYETIGWRDHWLHDFTKEEVIEGLQKLLAKKLIRSLVYDPNSKILVDSNEPVDFLNENDFWLRITELGWTMLRKWKPPS